MTEYIAHVRKSDKKPQRLETHLSEVGEISRELARKIDLPEAGHIIGLLHDLGKYSQAFQNYIKSAEGEIDPDQDGYVDFIAQKGKIDHSTAGAQYIWSKLNRIGAVGHGRLCGQILSLCIASHHSGLVNCLSKDGSPYFSKRIKKSDDLTHLNEALSKLDSELKQTLEAYSCKVLTKELFQRVCQIAGWSKSVKPLTKPQAFGLGMLTRFLFSCLVDADRLNSAEFEYPSRKKERLERRDYFDWSIAIDRLESNITTLSKGRPIDAIRSQISNECLQRAKDSQGTYTLTVPTGGGKTFASLRYALHHTRHHKLDRIIYIIPYTSIIEQNAQAVREIIECADDKFPWVLEHHSNLDPERESWRAKMIAENWDAPIVFTTMVQLLETFFAGGTRNARRMHQLGKAVLIFDEIQTLPLTCVHMFCNAINFLTQNAKTTAILCTATQPVLDKLRSPENGEIKVAPNAEIAADKSQLASILRRVEVVNRTKPGGWSESEIVNQTLHNLETVGSCLVIVNTKDWARRLYLGCKQSPNNTKIFHLSTNQYPVHRKQILNEIKQCLADKTPVICISTQLIEAGVDISFASVIRFLAGLDSIAQAAGRCNRHGELERDGEPALGRVEVINPDKENLAMLKDIECGKDISGRIFRDFSPEQLLAPETLERYFQYYFHQRSGLMSYDLKSPAQKTMVDILSTNQFNAGRDHASLKPAKLPLLKQSFMDAGKAFKAIDAPTQAVIIRHGDGKEIVTKLCAAEKEFDAQSFYSTLKQAQQYSVNVFPNVFKRLAEAGAVHEIQGEGIYYLEHSYYSEEFGLSTEPVAAMEVCLI